MAGVEITIGGLHLEWFGDPTAQTDFVAKWFRENVAGPAIILGDFNLEPRGNNRAAPNATAWTSLLDDGWVPTTPIEDAGCVGETDQHRCKSAVTTAMVTKTCVYPCWGYQLDWILYKGVELTYMDPDATDGTRYDVIDTCPLEPYEDYKTQAGWEYAVEHWNADVESLNFCSDHAALIGKFKVAPV